MANFQSDNQATDNLDTLLSLPIVNGEIQKIDELGSLNDTCGKNLTARDVILIKLTEKAIKGDMRAIELIVKIMGDKFIGKEPEEPSPTSDPRL